MSATEDIKIYYAPEVHLVQRPGPILKGLLEVWSPVEPPDQEGRRPGELLVETAGRLCYMSFGKGRKDQHDYVLNLLESQHGSVLEHVSWSFVIEGVSRTLTHELCRHRAGFAFSMLSQRYVDESEVGFVMPPLLRDEGSEDLKIEWAKMCRACLACYQGLVGCLRPLVNSALSTTEARKSTRQTARSVLPGCTETKIMVTANARAIRHFLSMRGSPAADAEIRELAVRIARIMAVEAPYLFQDMVIDETEMTVRFRFPKV